MKKFILLSILVFCAGNAYGMRYRSINIFNMMIVGVKDEQDLTAKALRRKEVDCLLRISGLPFQGGLRDAYEEAFGNGATPN